MSSKTVNSLLFSVVITIVVAGHAVVEMIIDVDNQWGWQIKLD